MTTMKVILLLLSTSSLVVCNGQEEKRAKIVRQINQINPDGSYNYAFETENQIFAEELGFFKDVESTSRVVQGQYQYTSPEGQIVGLFYVADENGFQAQGSHLPTPPPIPPIIERSLQFIMKKHKKH